MMTKEELEQKIGESFGNPDGEEAILIGMDDQFAYMMKMPCGTKIKVPLGNFCHTETEAVEHTLNRNANQ